MLQTILHLHTRLQSQRFFISQGKEVDAGHEIDGLSDA